MREFMDGSEAIVRGALAAGCNFFAGYPITPATPILLRMLRELPKIGGVGIQGEDEIASIGMCIGAAMTGAKAMTATSGPGISLYSENIGFAITGEVPLVIVDAQRLGPATGGATTVSQGDVQFLRWGTSGGFPIIALSPSNLAECFTLTQQAFNLAERFRTPVFIATDKEMVNAQQSVETDTFERLPVRDRVRVPAGQDYVPYRVQQLGDVPAFTPIGGEHITRLTGSMHDERGIITKKSASVDRTGRHLYEKIEAHRDELEFVKTDIQPGAPTLLVGYGTTARSMLQAAHLARAAGKRVSTLVVHSLWPVPERALRDALRGVARVVVPELNLGQYRLEVERLALALDPRPEVVGVNRVDGELITPQQIIERMKDEG
jgi:2-oxoglutarate ferredoxin oxidoreductase subunit alpha